MSILTLFAFLFFRKILISLMSIFLKSFFVFLIISNRRFYKQKKTFTKKFIVKYVCFKNLTVILILSRFYVACIFANHLKITLKSHQITQNHLSYIKDNFLNTFSENYEKKFFSKILNTFFCNI